MSTGLVTACCDPQGAVAVESPTSSSQQACPELQVVLFFSGSLRGGQVEVTKLLVVNLCSAVWLMCLFLRPRSLSCGPGCQQGPLNCLSEHLYGVHLPAARCQATSLVSGLKTEGKRCGPCMEGLVPPQCCLSFWKENGFCPRQQETMMSVSGTLNTNGTVVTITMGFHFK